MAYMVGVTRLRSLGTAVALGFGDFANLARNLRVNRDGDYMQMVFHNYDGLGDGDSNLLVAAMGPDPKEVRKLYGSMAKKVDLTNAPFGVDRVILSIDEINATGGETRDERICAMLQTR